MTSILNDKSAPGAHLNADLSKLNNKSYFKPFNKKIKPCFPPKASPLFCTFDKKIADYVNKVGFCYFICYKDYYLYDLNFSCGKEVWIFYLTQPQRELSHKLGFALLRHGAIRVQIDFFPLEGIHYVA